MKTHTLLPILFALIGAESLSAVEPSQSSHLPTISDLEKQDAVVVELKKKLAAETAKLNAMKSTFTDCADRALLGTAGQSGPVVEVDHATFQQRYEEFAEFESRKATEKKQALIDQNAYYPFKLRKTVLGQKESLDPATISYLKNNNGADSYAVDAGLLWDPLAFKFDFDDGNPLKWAQLDNIQLSPFAEYHRNTASSALNDTLVLGTNARLTLDKGDELSDFFQHIDLTGGWKNQSLTEGKSFFAQLQYAPLMRCYRLGLFGNGRLLPDSTNTSEWDQIRIVPTVALAYQHVYDGLLPAYEGDNLILKASADIEYFPKAWVFGALKDKLALRAGYTFWDYLSHTDHVSVPDRSMSFFHAGLDFYIDGLRPGPNDPSTGKDGHYAIGLEYTRGDNPDTGAYDVDQWLLSFRVFF